MNSSLRSWLGLAPAAATEPLDALRDLLDALDRLDPDRARYLAQFAYLLGRVAHADHHVSAGETEMMERLVRDEGGLSAEQAVLVIGLAKTANRLFGGTDNFIVARDFGATAAYEQKMALMRCLFALSATEGRISIEEEREIQRVGRELRIDPPDLLRLRLEYRRHLPGLAGGDEP